MAQQPKETLQFRSELFEDVHRAAVRLHTSGDGSAQLLSELRTELTLIQTAVSSERERDVYKLFEIVAEIEPVAALLKSQRREAEQSVSGLQLELSSLQKLFGENGIRGNTVASTLKEAIDMTSSGFVPVVWKWKYVEKVTPQPQPLQDIGRPESFLPTLPRLETTWCPVTLGPSDEDVLQSFQEHGMQVTEGQAAFWVPYEPSVTRLKAISRVVLTGAAVIIQDEGRLSGLEWKLEDLLKGEVIVPSSTARPGEHRKENVEGRNN